MYEKEKAMREGSVRGMYEMRGNDYNVRQLRRDVIRVVTAAACILVIVVQVH